MDIEGLINLVKKFVSFDVLMKWIGDKLVEEYGVKDLEVKRARDGVVLIIKSDDSNLDRIESELRTALGQMGFGKTYKVEVDVE